MKKSESEIANRVGDPEGTKTPRQVNNPRIQSSLKHSTAVRMTKGAEYLPLTDHGIIYRKPTFSCRYGKMEN